MHIFSVVPNQTLWGCVIKCTIFEHFMFPFRSGLVFPTLLMAFAMLFGCRNATKTDEPSNIVWIKNQHAELFRIGQTHSDSFLEVYDAPNTKLCIGKFFWGSSARIEGYQKITNREKIVSLSAIHTGMLAEMGLAKSIVGVESKQYIAHPQIYASTITNSWQELAPNGPIIAEKLAKLNPQLLIGYLFNLQEKNTIERIAKNHFPVVWANNHLEPHPLGRAEWIVALGWLMGKSKMCSELFQRIERDYMAIAKQATSVHPDANKQPTVMMNMPYNGQWFVPQGQSYIHRLIQDAGGKPVVLQPKGNASNLVGLEKALQAMKGADIWINTDNCNSKKCLTDQEPRVSQIKALQNNQVFNFNKKLNPNGSNAYWDVGCIFPNLILRDLANILQNDTQSLYFYQRCN